MNKENFEYNYEGVITYLKRNKITVTLMVIGTVIAGIAIFLNSINSIKDNYNKLNISGPNATGGTATVIVKRAYFYNKPDVSTKQMSYVILGDEVRYSKCEENFIYGSFTNKKGDTTQGWMWTSDFEF